MNVLDSPLDALALNYFNFGFLTAVNSVWTWIAFATAALSFWRIRASACSQPELLPPPSYHRASEGSDALSVPGEVGEPPRPAFVPAVVGNCNVELDGVTKGKFTVYYEDAIDGQCDNDESLTATEEWDSERVDGKTEWWENWEKLLRVRTGEGENGWYTCQDLTAINGNVVRFWEGETSFGTLKMEQKAQLKLF